MPKPGDVGVPRVTHQWLTPVLDYIDLLGRVITPSGASSGIAQGQTVGFNTPITQIGNATGVVGFYGATGIAQLSTGTNGITAWTGAGASAGLLWFNGGSGAFYTLGDVVTALKNNGILKP